METNINKLLNGLQMLNTVDAVRRINDSYALNDAGQVTAISLSKENKKAKNISRLLLDEEAVALQYINVSGIETLNEIVFRNALPELIYADFSRCVLTEITLPAGFLKLEQLYLHNNKLQQITFQGACANMILLDLAKNQLSSFSLPPGFKKLAYLYLPDNLLKTLQLPADAKELNILHLRNNKLEDLPESLVDFTNIEALYLYGNPLPSLPKQIISEDERASSWEAVKNYLISISQGSVINTKAKIILIGNGNVGKTTLSHQLRKNEFIENYERTHGILIKEWKILKKDFPQNLSEKIQQNINIEKKKNPKAAQNLTFPEQITLSLWDFGGQEYYHATHRLFLNNNVIYLLLWDKETDYLDESKGMYPLVHWQQNISYYAPQNITFFIQNKAKSDYRFIEKDLLYKINHRDNSIEQTIQQYNSDILLLKSGIMNQFANLDFLGQPFPKVYDDIRNALKNETRPVLLFNEFERLCFRTDKTTDKIMKKSGQIETLTNLLHDTGAIICYRYKQEPVIDKRLKEFVFTNPEWVTNVIYDILSKGLINSNGEFDYDFLHDALSVSKALKEQPDSLSNDNWISLMKSFELIFEVKKGENTVFVAPQYLPWECKNQEAFKMTIAGRNLKSIFTLNYPSYIPNSLFLRFITKFGAQSSPTFIYWKKGLVFFSKDKLAYVEYLKENEDHRIHVQVQDGDNALANEIFEYFYKQSNDSTQISINRQDFVPVQLLINSQSFGGCNLGDLRFPCKDFPFIFGSIEKPELFNEADPAAIGDDTRSVFISYSHDSMEHKDWIRSVAEQLIKYGIDVFLDQYELGPGRNMITFMEDSVAKSDKVLTFYTPNYKLKAEDRKGGVGFEYSIITVGLYKQIKENNKYIPVLREGNFESSIPEFIQQFIAVDMRDDKSFEEKIKELVLAIYDQPQIKKPLRGRRPDYTF